MKLKIDGKTVTLKPLNLNGIIEFEQETGVKFVDIGKVAEDFAIARKLFYIAIKRVMPDITEEQVGECIELGNFGEIASFLAGGTHEVNPPTSD